MDVNATNYDSEAEVDDGSCEYPEPIGGCMDINATYMSILVEVVVGELDLLEGDVVLHPLGPCGG